MKMTAFTLLRFYVPKVLGIYARFLFAAHKVSEDLAVFLIGNALPYRVGGDDLDVGIAAVDEILYAGGKEELALGEVRLVCVQKVNEHIVKVVAEGGSEAEAVHGNGGILGERANGAVVEGIDDHAVVLALDLFVLVYLDKVGAFVSEAYAAGNGTVVAQGVLYLIADHAVVRLVAVFCIAQEARELHECVSAVAVVSVDNAEVVVDLACGHDGVSRTEGLYAAFGNLEALGKLLLLICVTDIDAVGTKSASDLFLEELFVFGLDDDDEFVKACELCVVDGEVHDEFALVRKRGQLLHAAETAAHAGCHNNQSHIDQFLSV